MGTTQEKRASSGIAASTESSAKSRDKVLCGTFFELDLKWFLGCRGLDLLQCFLPCKIQGKQGKKVKRRRKTFRLSGFASG